METEYEIKILDINPTELKLTLKKLRAKHIGKYNYRRYIFSLYKENSWIRLRSDGKQHTLTYKQVITNTIDGVKELEVTVDDFERTKQILIHAGLKQQDYQENSRDLYILDGVEISLDKWPKLPTFAEIEGSNIENVRQMVNKLGLAKYKSTSKPISGIYELYNINMS